MLHKTIDFSSLAVSGVRALQPYQPGKPESALKREYGLDDVIKLASNENPMGPGTRAIEAAGAELQGAHRYPDGAGFALRHALAERHAVDPMQVTLGNGSNDVLALVANAFLEPGREAVFSAHAFAVYPIVTQAAGASAVVVPANAPDHAMPFGHDLEAMAAAVSERTRVVFVANPNNPTGTWLQADPLRAFLQGLPAEVIAVVDEAYFEYADDPDYPDASLWLQEFPNLVVTRTFSKAHGLAALRVGYGLSHPAVADLLNRVRQPFNVSSVAQAAALASLADQDYIAQSVALNREQRDWLRQALQSMGLQVLPSAGNFLCFRVGERADAIYEGLLRRGVILRPVANYALPGFLRVTVGLPAENARFVEALQAELRA
ncbi:histidinol-phosphate transaminase [Methylonatrum kenyense]|uniref:histidinol-phosphate transaminase n=1 Tax=Methylonatrum kenyense TaxID=455253 RepID=UPI0020C114A5|nr:histidinol-phosphate transaminase [Methylonatrum kenyense]MCK8515971.1 histidinol-phosphate transaminase [Methylonatrum kenyense]